MAAARKKSATVNTVVAPLVQATIGDRVLHYYRGDVLPEGVSEESLENLRSLGFVEETKVDAPAEPDAE